MRFGLDVELIVEVLTQLGLLGTSRKQLERLYAKAARIVLTS